MSNTITNRYDFVLIFDIKDGNPNGDPDAGNLPRIDPETGQGLVTDVCLKRKIRNFVQMTKQGVSSFDIFVRSKELSGIETFLNKEIRLNYEAINIDINSAKDADGKERKNKGKAQGSEIEAGRKSMCKKYYDIRTFGAVLSTGANAGQVRGPIQLTFARSVDQIVTLEHSLTVCAARDEEKPYEAQVGIQGRKNTVPYGIYVSYGFISPHLAAQTGFNDADLELFWSAMISMFENVDRSAARGMMSTCKLVIFKHDSALGNAASKSLFDRICIKKNDADKPARDVSDYTISICRDNLPDGIKVIEKP
jgi:CRISPR-associated protein Csd2